MSGAAWMVLLEKQAFGDGLFLFLIFLCLRLAAHRGLELFGRSVLRSSWWHLIKELPVCVIRAIVLLLNYVLVFLGRY